MLTRKVKVFTGFAVLGALGLSSCGSDGESGEEAPESIASIDVGVAPDFFYTHLYFAVEGGFFEDHGIDATLTEYPSGVEAVEAITAGQNDITSSTAPSMAATAGSGSVARAIGTNFVGDQWFGMVAAGDYGDVSSGEELDGARIATQFSSSVDMHSRMVLEESGLTVDDVEYSDVQVAQLISGLGRNEFDAVSLWEPNVSQAAAEIPNATVVPGSMDVFDTTGYLIAGDDIYEDQEVTDAVLAAITDAIEWIGENPDEVLERVMSLSGISDEELAQSVQDKVLYEATPLEDTHIEELESAAAFYVEQEVLDATDEEIADIYMTEPYENWENGEG